MIVESQKCACHARPSDDLHARDVRGGKKQHPGSVRAELVGGRVNRGLEALDRVRDRLRRPGGTGGRHHEGDLARIGLTYPGVGTRTRTARARVFARFRAFERADQLRSLMGAEPEASGTSEGLADAARVLSLRAHGPIERVGR